MKFDIRNLINTISKKMVIIFLIAIIPVYILGISIYNWGYGMIEKEISNSRVSQVEFYLNSLETEISRMKDLEYECVNDEDLNYLVNASQIMNDYEKTEAMLIVQKRLSVMKNSSIYIQNVCVHMPSIRKTISANDGVSELSQDWDTILNAVVDKSDAGITYWKNNMYLIVKYPNSIQDKTRKPLFILEIELSDFELKNRLLTFTKYNKSGSLLINQKQQYDLVSNSEDGNFKEILGKINTERNLKSIGTYSFKLKTGEYQIAYKNSQYLNMQLISYIPKDQVYAPIKKYQILFVFFTIASVIIMIFFYISTNALIHKPLKKLVNSFGELEKGNLSMRIEHKHTDEFKYLYKSFNVMVKNLSELIGQVYKQKILAQRSELKQLQSQINPHFLYNSFFILYRMAKDEDNENIVRFSQHLAEYYRFVTKNAVDEVSLLREVTHAKTYLDIQVMRFYNRIDIKFGEIPDKYKELNVPRLIIQPIIENTFEHGFKDTSDKGIVIIEFIELEKGLSISIQDNGSFINESELERLKLLLNNEDETKDCTGIINIHRRLILKFGAGSGIVLSKSDLGGLKVEIIIFLGGVEISA